MLHVSCRPLAFLLALTVIVVLPLQTGWTDQFARTRTGQPTIDEQSAVESLVEFARWTRNSSWSPIISLALAAYLAMIVAQLGRQLGHALWFHPPRVRQRRNDLNLWDDDASSDEKSCTQPGCSEPQWSGEEKRNWFSTEANTSEMLGSSANRQRRMR